MLYKPNLDAIEAIKSDEARMYAALGAVILTAAAIESSLLAIAQKLLPIERVLATKIFANAQPRAKLVNQLMARADAVSQQRWEELRPRVARGLGGPRHVAAHGQLDVQTILLPGELASDRALVWGVPGPAGFLSSTGIAFVDFNIALQQHPDFVAAGTEQSALSYDDLMTHCREQAQTLADIRSFEAKLPSPPQA